MDSVRRVAAVDQQQRRILDEGRTQHCCVSARGCHSVPVSEQMSYHEKGMRGTVTLGRVCVDWVGLAWPGGGGGVWRRVLR